MPLIMRMDDVLLRSGETGIYVEAARLGAMTVPLSEVPAFCAALTAKAEEVRARLIAGQGRRAEPAASEPEP